MEVEHGCLAPIHFTMVSYLKFFVCVLQIVVFQLEIVRELLTEGRVGCDRTLHLATTSFGWQYAEMLNAL